MAYEIKRIVNGELRSARPAAAPDPKPASPPPSAKETREAQATWRNEVKGTFKTLRANIKP
jgi:hypothetical protein